MPWHSCPGKWWGHSPSLEVFKDHGDVALRDVVSGHGGSLWLNLVIVVAFSNLNDTVILLGSP